MGKTKTLNRRAEDFLADFFDVIARLTMSNLITMVDLDFVENIHTKAQV